MQIYPNSFISIYRFDTESVVESLHGSVLDEIISSSLKGKIKKRKGNVEVEQGGTQEEREMLTGETEGGRYLKRYTCVFI